MASSSRTAAVNVPDPKFCMLVVAPDGRVHLVNAKTKLVYWSYLIRDHDNQNGNNRIYSGHHGKDVSDYVDAVVDGRGSIRLHQYEPDKPPEVIPWKSDGYVERYLKTRYGEDIVFKPTQNDVTRLDIKKGRYLLDGLKTENFIRIESKKFEIYTKSWRLQFSLYEASFILKEDDVRPIRVHITHDADALKSLCEKLGVHSERITHDLWVSSKLLHPITMEDTPLNECYPKIFGGRIGGSYEVVVKSYPIGFLLPPMLYTSMWGSKHSHYTPALYGINVDHQDMHLVFERCKSSLYDHIFKLGELTRWGVRKTKRDKLRPESMRKIMRSLIQGLQCLKEKSIRHKKLNPWNLLVTEDESVKIVGFSSMEEGTPTQEGTPTLDAGELRDLAKLFILLHGKPIDSLSEESYEDLVLTVNNMDDSYLEAKRLVIWMQDPNQIPPLLDEIAFYTNVWEDIKKIGFFKDVSSFLEPYDEESLIKDLVDGMFHERKRSFRSNTWKNSSWKNMVPKGVLAQLEEAPDEDEKRAFGIVGNEAMRAFVKDVKGAEYRGDNPRHLLKFIRNLLTHLPIIFKGKKLSDADRNWLGGDPVTLLNSFEKLFPHFRTDLYDYLRLNVSRARRLKSLGAYYG